MDVGIIGAGRLGQAMARTALRAGRQNPVRPPPVDRSRWA